MVFFSELVTFKRRSGKPLAESKKSYNNPIVIVSLPSLRRNEKKRIIIGICVTILRFETRKNPTARGYTVIEISKFQNKRKINKFCFFRGKVGHAAPGLGLTLLVQGCPVSIFCHFQ